MNRISVFSFRDHVTPSYIFYVVSCNVIAATIIQSILCRCNVWSVSLMALYSKSIHSVSYCPYNPSIRGSRKFSREVWLVVRSQLTKILTPLFLTSQLILQRGPIVHSEILIFFGIQFLPGGGEGWLQGFHFFQAEGWGGGVQSNCLILMKPNPFLSHPSGSAQSFHGPAISKRREPIQIL